MAALLVTSQDQKNNNWDYSNQYSQLPIKYMKRLIMHKGQHLLDQEAKGLQAETVICATTLVVTGEAVVAKFAGL